MSSKSRKSSHLRALSGNHKEGFMEKKTGLLSIWRNRYFVLMRDLLCYFKREDQKESMTPSGRIFFGDIVTIEKFTKRSRPFCIVITEEEKKHLMSCSSENERDAWLDAINDGKNHHHKQEKFDPVRRKSARIGKDLKRVTIQKDEGGGIGCTIKNVGGAIFVNRIIPDGPVAISGVLRPGDQIVDINGIKISGSSIEKIKEVIKQSPEYVVCTVKPVTHYANSNDSPDLPRTSYTEIDPLFLKSLSDGEQDDTGTKAPPIQMYANIEFTGPRKPERDVETEQHSGTASGLINATDDKGTVQNYAELDFTRR